MKKRLLILFIILAFALVFLSACNPEVVDKEVIEVRVENFQSYSLYQGDELDLSEATVYVEYDNGDEEIIPLSKEMISGYQKNITGKQTVSVICGRGETTFEVEVLPLEIQSVEVGSRPETLSVVQGNALDLNGVTLRIYYQNKSAIVDTVTASMVSGYDANTAPGTYQITISYAGFTTKTELVVLRKTLTSIAVNSRPTDVNYFIGEDLSPEGLSLSLVYDNGSKETLAYSEDNKSDFNFVYNFNTELPAAPVKVKYRNTYETTFTVVVTAPVCVNLEMEYKEIVYENGVPVSKKFELYPESYGVSLEGAAATRHPITSMIEGESIDWSTGSARLTYDNGETEIVKLNHNSIYVSILNSANKPVDAKAKVYSEPGNYILYVKYGNMVNSTPLYVTVRSKQAVKLLLENTESVTNRTYVEGMRVITDPILYNILYDNGTYLYASSYDNSVAAPIADWGFLTVDMLAEDSNFYAEYNEVTNGIQSINFTKDGVTSGIKVTVDKLKIQRLILNPPTRNFVKVGGELNLSGAGLYVSYNNSEYETVSVTSDMLTYSLNGNDKISFDEAGEYTVTVSYMSKTAEFIVTAVAESEYVVELQVVNMPTEVPRFSEYADINFSAIDLRAVYADDTEVNPHQAEFSATEAMVFSVDSYNPGYQEIGIRYGGATVFYPVYIVGRQTTSVVIKTYPKSEYFVGETFDVAGLSVTRTFSDDTSSIVTDFNNKLWSFTLPDMSTCGAKTVYLNYLGSSDRVIPRVEIQINVSTRGVSEISFDTEQSELSNGRIVVTKGKEINATGLTLNVKYEGESAFVSIPLQAGYIVYDKNYNPVNAGNESIGVRNVTLFYGGKSIIIEIEVVERQLVSIEVENEPYITIYVDGQDIDLSGGTLLRTYDNGDSDIIPLDSQLIVNDYEKNYYEKNSVSDPTITQKVNLTSEGKSTTLDVVTYRKTTCPLSYADTVSFYGSVKTPRIVITPPVSAFEIPETFIEYKVSGEWTAVQPKIPGTYPLRVTVVENDYYHGSVVEEQSLVIIKKYIEIRANDFLKYYGAEDPTFTYWTEGDVTDPETGKTTNTVLVYNDGVQDRLSIRLFREVGDDVKLNDSGAVIGYKIRYELDNSIPSQNDRYSIDFTAGELKIERMVITAKINFSGATNLISDGSPKVITASYVSSGGLNIVIPAEDIIYTDSVGNVLDTTPWAPGTYTAMLSDNFTVVGTNSITYTIQSA